MSKFLFSQVSQTLINKELGAIYHGFKGTTTVEIRRGKRTIEVPVDGYRLEAQMYLAEDSSKRTLMTLDFGYVTTRSNKLAHLVSKLVKKPFASVEELAKIVSLAAREEKAAFMRQAQANHRHSQEHHHLRKK